jgi:predicted acyltransferase
MVEGPVTDIDTIKNKRILSIDAFRGFTILGMILINTISNSEKIPSWSKHSTDFGLTFIDLGAPLFIFAIALTYKMSYDRNLERKGIIETYLKFFRRYGAFLGFGFLGSKYIITKDGINFSWGVLQAIGFAGIFTLIFIATPSLVRYLVSLSILGIYQNISVFQINIQGTLLTISDWILNDRHGGLIGGVIWGAMMLLCTAMIDDYRSSSKHSFLVIGILFTSIGTAFHFIWQIVGSPQYIGISKERLTPAFILISVGLSAAFYWLFWLIYDKFSVTKNKSILQPLGKNAFLLYLFHPLFGFISSLYLKPNSHIVFVLLSATLNLILLWLIAYLLDKKKIYIII